MEILRLIKKDHGDVKSLFKKVEQRAEIPGVETEGLVGELVNEILLHAKAEEKTLYIHCRQRTDKLREFALEGHVEHKLLEIAVKRLSVVPPGRDGKFKAVLAVAKELFFHHAVEEEEKGIFPKIMKAFSMKEREELGTRMAEIKEGLRGNPNNFKFKDVKIANAPKGGATKKSRVTGAAAAIGPEGVVQTIRPENRRSPGAVGALPSRNPELVPGAVVPAPSAGVAGEVYPADEAPRSEQLKKAV